MKPANGCGHFSRRLWPGLYSPTPMLSSWLFAPTALFCNKHSSFSHIVC